MANCLEQPGAGVTVPILFLRTDRRPNPTKTQLTSKRHSSTHVAWPCIRPRHRPPCLTNLAGAIS